LYVSEWNAVPDTRMVSWLFEVLIEAPLASAAAWFILAALQIYRDRWHTWTEAFFLFCCFFAGLYATGDWRLFHSVSEPYARLSALVSLTGLTLAVNFFLLFTLVYVDRMRRAYWALIAVSIVILLPVFRFGISIVNLPPAGAPTARCIRSAESESRRGLGCSRPAAIRSRRCS